MKDAAINLAMIYGGEQFGMPDKHEYLHWLKKLAYDFMDGWGQVRLGIILYPLTKHAI